MNNALIFNEVSFSYDETTFMENFNLTINKGEYVAIVGANGSGKTTFSKLISGILVPKKGEIRIDGMSLFSEKNGEVNYDTREKVSVVLQNPEDQFVGSSVREDIAFGLENHQVPREMMDAIINKCAEDTGIVSLLDKEPTQLSGGQKQRVAIASNLALKTDYMIFDEATSQLDPVGKKEVMSAIEQLVALQQKTILIVTHDLEEILRADRVIVFDKGNIAVDTSPRELFNGTYDLEKYNLVAPRAFAYSEVLKKDGLIEATALSIEELVGELCK